MERGRILTEEMQKLIEKELGKTAEELWETDFPEMTPERDASLKHLEKVRGSVRIYTARVYTAKDLEEKRKKIMSK